MDSSNITIDQVDITAQYGSGGPSFSIRNGTAWSIGTSDGNPRRISGTSPPWQGVELAKRIPSGTLYVDAYTDIEAPTPGTSGQPVNVRAGDQIVEVFEIDFPGPIPGSLNGVAGSFHCPGNCEWEYDDPTDDGIDNGRVVSVSGVVFTPTATSARSDTDYLAGGVWLIAPDDATSAADFQFGAFGDGSDPFMQSNLAPVMGTATYRGDAVGVYSQKEAGTSSVGYLEADVRLNANFGNANGLGSISGSITSFVVDGSHEEGALILGAAPIGAQNSGFFRGSVSDDGQIDSRDITGQWGGQFFGNGESDGKPGSVGGTFGAHSTDFPDIVGGGELSIVGTFGAHKQ